jgi:hypothetical protein
MLALAASASTATAGGIEATSTTRIARAGSSEGTYCVRPERLPEGASAY